MAPSSENAVTFGNGRRVLIEKLTGLGLAGPALLLLLLLHIVPLIMLVVLSLTDYQLGDLALNFVGLKNFSSALQDDAFRRSLFNTFIYVAIVVPGSVGLGLLFALLIHGRKQSRAIYEVVFFLPVTATLIAMASVWKFLLHPTLGPINAVIVALGFEPVNFLSDPSYALPTLAVIGIWQLVGFNMVLFLAGLSSIPKDLYEAADIDGAAGVIDRFLTVTWPMLGPTTMFVLITTSITAFKVFDTVVAITRGGPQDSTNVILYAIYLEGFQYFSTAYAAALTLVFLTFILIFSGIQTFLIDRRVHY
ncbi:carbohydrate ABC transporter permease [Brucella cytisi]|jgi:multiple sugar transport system permease protein|uniref:carbohydrate ABC transporter permease n=1 Tax=Brucella cytisi TaxID=407152 RepID=UPI0035DE8FE7